MRRALLIVARHDPLMYSNLKRIFAKDRDIEVVLDRRQQQRRRRSLQPQVDRRMRERRSSSVDAWLRRWRWAVVEPTSQAKPEADRARPGRPS